MAKPSLGARVEILEEKVDRLEGLPAWMESLELQILQFRESVGVEFSAVHEEFGKVHTELADVHTELANVRREMQEGVVAVTTEFGTQIMRLESRLSALFEDAISRLKTIGEGGPS